MNNQKRLTVGCLAKELGICTETIRYYHRIGLLPVPPRAPGSTVRRYGEEDVRLLRFIKQAQHLGFSLEEIRGLLTLSRGSHCEEVQCLARQKLCDLEKKMLEIAHMRDTIRALLNECANNEGESQCPLIEALLHDASRLSVSRQCGGAVH
jgi:MerR family mercuric resistance operon transcriptional regulator